MYFNSLPHTHRTHVESRRQPALLPRAVLRWSHLPLSGARAPSLRLRGGEGENVDEGTEEERDTRKARPTQKGARRGGGVGGGEIDGRAADTHQVCQKNRCTKTHPHPQMN